MNTMSGLRKLGHLPTKEMELWAGVVGLTISNSIRAQLEESLDSGGGVLGPMPSYLRSRQTRPRRPHFFWAGDELIEVDLSGIGEVPGSQMMSIRVAQGVPYSSMQPPSVTGVL